MKAKAFPWLGMSILIGLCILIISIGAAAASGEEGFVVSDSGVTDRAARSDIDPSKKVRYVTISGGSEYLHFSKLQVFAYVNGVYTDVALNKTITASPAWGESTNTLYTANVPVTLDDINRHYHSANIGATWQVDLGNSYDVQEIVLRNINANDYQERINGYTIAALTNLLKPVWSSPLNNDVWDKANKTIRFRPLDVARQYIRIDGGNDYLNFRKIEIYATINGVSTNIAPNGRCISSGATWDSSTSSPASASGGFFHSVSNSNAFWEIDLGRPYPIESIVIINRLDGLQNRISSFTIKCLGRNTRYPNVDSRDLLWSSPLNDTVWPNKTTNLSLTLTLPANQIKCPEGYRADYTPKENSALPCLSTDQSAFGSCPSGTITSGRYCWPATSYENYFTLAAVDQASYDAALGGGYLKVAKGPTLFARNGNSVAWNTYRVRMKTIRLKKGMLVGINTKRQLYFMGDYQKPIYRKLTVPIENIDDISFDGDRLIILSEIQNVGTSFEGRDLYYTEEFRKRNPTWYRISGPRFTKVAHFGPGLVGYQERIKKGQADTKIRECILYYTDNFTGFKLNADGSYARYVAPPSQCKDSSGLFRGYPSQDGTKRLYMQADCTDIGGTFNAADNTCGDRSTTCAVLNAPPRESSRISGRVSSGIRWYDATSSLYTRNVKPNDSVFLQDISFDGNIVMVILKGNDVLGGPMLALSKPANISLDNINNNVYFKNIFRDDTNVSLGDKISIFNNKAITLLTNGDLYSTPDKIDQTGTQEDVRIAIRYVRIEPDSREIGGQILKGDGNAGIFWVPYGERNKYGFNKILPFSDSTDAGCKSDHKTLNVVENDTIIAQSTMDQFREGSLATCSQIPIRDTGTEQLHFSQIIINDVNGNNIAPGKEVSASPPLTLEYAYQEIDITDYRTVDAEYRAGGCDKQAPGYPRYKVLRVERNGQQVDDFRCYRACPDNIPFEGSKRTVSGGVYDYDGKCNNFYDGATNTQVTARKEFTKGLANDGDLRNRYYKMYASAKKRGFYEVDLGSPQYLSSVRILNRRDQYQERLSRYFLKFYDSERNLIKELKLNGTMDQTYDVTPFLYSSALKQQVQWSIISNGLKQADLFSGTVNIGDIAPTTAADLFDATVGIGQENIAKCKGVTGRYIRVRPSLTSGDGCLQLSQVVAFGVDGSKVNLAAGKVVEANSTESDSNASYAVDETYDPKIPPYIYSSAAQGGFYDKENTYWHVDLGQMREIAYIVILGRPDSNPERHKGVRVEILSDVGKTTLPVKTFTLPTDDVEQVIPCCTELFWHCKSNTLGTPGIFDRKRVRVYSSNECNGSMKTVTDPNGTTVTFNTNYDAARGSCQIVNTASVQLPASATGNLSEDCAGYPKTATDAPLSSKFGGFFKLPPFPPGKDYTGSDICAFNPVLYRDAYNADLLNEITDKTIDLYDIKFLIDNFKNTGIAANRSPCGNLNPDCKYISDANFRNLYYQYQADVKGAGADPLTHYKDYGLREGRGYCTIRGQIPEQKAVPELKSQFRDTSVAVTTADLPACTAVNLGNQKQWLCPDNDTARKLMEGPANKTQTWLNFGDSVCVKRPVSADDKRQIYYCKTLDGTQEGRNYNFTLAKSHNASCDTARKVIAQVDTTIKQISDLSGTANLSMNTLAGAVTSMDQLYTAMNCAAIDNSSSDRIRSICAVLSSSKESISMYGQATQGLLNTILQPLQAVRASRASIAAFAADFDCKL